MGVSISDEVVYSNANCTEIHKDIVGSEYNITFTHTLGHVDPVTVKLTIIEDHFDQDKTGKIFAKSAIVDSTTAKDFASAHDIVGAIGATAIGDGLPIVPNAHADKLAAINVGTLGFYDVRVSHWFNEGMRKIFLLDCKD